MLESNLYWGGVMMLYRGEADGLVAGAANATSAVYVQLYKSLNCSGYFFCIRCLLMLSPYQEFGEEGVLLFADCAVNPLPTAKQLAEIAVVSAQTAVSLIGLEPKVALLSFSTKGSAQHELVEQVRLAVKLAKEKAPDLIIDGELQADTALVPEVALAKATGKVRIGGAA